MITISELTDADKGREVRYRTHGATEYGYITSWNDKVIFVLYHMRMDESGGVLLRHGTTSEATSPEDLEFRQ